MQVRFSGSTRDRRRTDGNGNGHHDPAPATGLRLLYKRLRSRARWPRTWTWGELSRLHRRLVLGALVVVALVLAVILWPARGFEAWGVVAAQRVELAAEASLTVTDCYVRVGDRIEAGDPLYVTVNGDPDAELAGIEERLAALRLRQLGLEAAAPAAAPELADESERLAAAETALAATRDALAALPEAPDLAAIDLQLGTAAATVDNAMSAHRRSQRQLGEIERLRALDAAPIGDLRSAEDREGERYRALQDALLHKRELEAERSRLIADHALQRAALEDRLAREEEYLAAVEERLARRRDRLVADLGDEIARLKAEGERVRDAHAPRTHLAPAGCVVRAVHVTDGTTLIAGAPIVELDLDDRLRVQAYVPREHRDDLEAIQSAWIFPDENGRIPGRIATKGKVALELPTAVRQRVDHEDLLGLLVVVEPDPAARLVPGEVVRLRLW